jgi:hypothetical protein
MGDGDIFDFDDDDLPPFRKTLAQLKQNDEIDTVDEDDDDGSSRFKERGSSVTQRCQ